jgi:hypothetical protein
MRYEKTCIDLPYRPYDCRFNSPGGATRASGRSKAVTNIFKTNKHEVATLELGQTSQQQTNRRSASLLRTSRVLGYGMRACLRSCGRELRNATSSPQTLSHLLLHYLLRLRTLVGYKQSHGDDRRQDRRLIRTVGAPARRHAIIVKLEVKW